MRPEGKTSLIIFTRRKTAAIVGMCVVGMFMGMLALIPGELPGWLPHPGVNLGLDLQGGSYLLLEVDANAVAKDRLDNARATSVQALREAGIAGSSAVVRRHSLILHLANEIDAHKAQKVLTALLAQRTGGPANVPVFRVHVDGPQLTLALADQALMDLSTKAASQSIAIVRRRIDDTGVNEPVVAQQGSSRILVELPGIADPGRIRRLLGSTAKLTFHLVAPNATTSAADTELLPLAKARGTQQEIPVRKHVEVDGADLTDASPGRDPGTHEWVVNFALNGAGARHFAELTKQHVGQPLAIVLDNKVISAPIIREPILGGRGQISGQFTVAEANDLAVLLRAGALPAPLQVVEERSIGPSLGSDAIHAGLVSILVGFSLVVSFMVAMYGRFGAYAAVALVVNLGLTMAGLALRGATLTLPGIAGILLAVGMAVDANILINERVRDELAAGHDVITAIEQGFRRAYVAITDANLTTLIKMLILFAVGRGPIKGFAVTISLGIVVSMFTAIVLVRLLISRWLRKARPKALAIGTRLRLFPDNTVVPFMRARHWGLIVSAMISMAALALAYHPGLKMGVDFTGGILVEARTPQVADFALLRQRLGSLGLGPVQVQQFGTPQEVLLRFDQQQGGTGHQETIDRIRAALQAVAPGSEVRRVDAVGADISSELFHGGMLALGLAAVAMFGYIAFRFTWRFAAGAIITVFLDLTKTVGFFAATGIEFNLTSIAAILAIMGFSINDMVIVYDRIRENLRVHKDKTLGEVIDLSISQTLARTLSTSAALFLAIAPLALFGGPALRQFAIVLLFGLMLAAGSSIFVAAPILLNLSEASWRTRRAKERGHVVSSDIR